MSPEGCHASYPPRFWIELGGTAGGLPESRKGELHLNSDLDTGFKHPTAHSFAGFTTNCSHCPAYPPPLIVLSSQWSNRADQSPPDSRTTLLLSLSVYNAPLPPPYLYAPYSYLLPATQCYDNGEAKLAGQRDHKSCKLMGGMGEERKWLAEESRGLWQPSLEKNTI